MDTVLKNLIGTECFNFIDDLIIYSRTEEEYASRLGNVLHKLEEANLQFHPGKCVFAKSQVQYLGYILSENGISTSPEKVNTRSASGASLPESANGGQIDRRVLYRLLIYIMLSREGKYLKIINCLKVVIYFVMFYTYNVSNRPIPRNIADNE